MGNPNGRQARWLLLAAFMASAATAYAACSGPQQLTARLRQHPTTENAVALGSWFAEHQQFACAAETFRAALRSDPNSAQLYYLEGLALLNSGQQAEARKSIEQSVKLAPDVAKPHLLLARLYMQNNMRQAAEKQWQSVLELDPHNEQALEELSDALIAREDYRDTAYLLEPAPRTERLTINLAKAKGRMHDIDGAYRVLDEARKLYPDSLPLIDAISVVMVRQSRIDEAIVLVRRAVQDRPGNIDAEILLFRMLVLTGNIAEARPMAPKLLAARPRNAELLSLTGSADRSAGDYALARSHLEEAVAIDPNDSEAQFNLGTVLAETKEWTEAKMHLEKAIELGAPEPQTHFHLARALRALGENSRAEEEMRRFADLKREEDNLATARTNAALGDTAFKEGHFDEATEQYRQAVDNQPKNPAYRYKLALTLGNGGDLAGEQAQLEEALKLDPGMAAAHKELGYLLARSGDAEGSIQHFQAAVQYAPAWVDAWINLAGELAVAGRFPQAREAAERALRLDPANAQARKLNDLLARDPRSRQSQN